MPTITLRQQQMIEALKAMPVGWHSRNEIAAHLGKRILAPYDIAVLELLAEQGVIKRRLVPTEVEHISRIEYRSVEREAEHEQKTAIGSG